MASIDRNLKSTQSQSMSLRDKHQQDVDRLQTKFLLLEMACDLFADEAIDKKTYISIKFLIKSPNDSNRELAEKILRAKGLVDTKT